MFRRIKKLRSLMLCGVELIESIDRHELNASRAVDFLSANLSQDLFHDPFGPAVAVVIGIFEQLTAFTQKSVVHAPRINTDARKFHFAQSREGFPRFGPKSRHIPVERSAVFDWFIGETMHFFCRENS